jgi:phosphonate transport system substrate-binding protein
LRVGVLPDQSQVELESRYEPLIAYLQQSLGREVELLVPTSYADLLDVFDQGLLDLAWFGGLTFTRAVNRSGAVPLVMRDIDLEFTSVFLVPRLAEGHELHDFGGKSLAFGPSLSTSGHLMPRHHLVDQGIDPEAFFSDVRHSAGHDQTASWVQAGQVALGAVNSLVLETMIQDGRLDRDRVRVLDRTAPYQNYVWVVPAELDQDGLVRLRDAFLELDRTLPEHERVLAALGAGAFLPASSAQFDGLREAARLVGPLGTDPAE